MLYHTSIDSMLETNFALIQHHNWSLNDIENMLPWERDVYVNYLVKYLEKQKLEAKQAEAANANTGRRTQSRTPMFQIGRRMNFVGRNLSNISEETKIERPQIRILGRVISQLDSMNSSLRDMSTIIRRDVDSKQKYYREELKILKKDSENLQSTNYKII